MCIRMGGITKLGMGSYESNIDNNNDKHNVPG